MSRKIYPRVPCRVPDRVDEWRVYYVPRSVMPIINREGLQVELRRLHDSCLQGTADRRTWLQLHVALTLELETATGWLLRRDCESLRSRLHHLVGFSPALGDRPRQPAPKQEPLNLRWVTIHGEKMVAFDANLTWTYRGRWDPHHDGITPAQRLEVESFYAAGPENAKALAPKTEKP